jgi:hypothetical protein
MHKQKCPQNCIFRELNSPIAKLPVPDKIDGVIISRDPTFAWLYLYSYTRTEESDVRRKILFSSAIPSRICLRILRFMGIKPETEEAQNLYEKIMQYTYWTHLHKCFTHPQQASFKRKTAKLCADKWLAKELPRLFELRPKFLLALGNHVQSWIRKWMPKSLPNTAIINLPHPSGQNNPIWYRSQKERYRQQIEDTERQIDMLFALI